MNRVLLIVVASVAISACNLSGFADGEDPGIPDDFPQVSDGLDNGRVELSVDGAPFSVAATCMDRGLDQARPFWVRAEALDLSTRSREVGVYRASDDGLRVVWTEDVFDMAGGDYASSGSCGESVVRVDGDGAYEDKFDDEKVAVWGTLQLRVCNDRDEVLEISGKFSCADL